MSQLKPIRGICLNRNHPLARGLVGYWLFNEGSGGKVFDSSGHGRIGTLVADTNWVSGEFGFALGFDGNGDEVTVPALDAIRLDKDFTVVYTGTAGARGDMVFSQTVSGNERFEIHLLDSGLPNLVSGFYDGTDGNGYQSTVEITEFSHHSFAVVRFSDRSAKLYTDGIEGTVSSGWLSPSPTPTDFLIGRAGYLGQLDYVFIYARGLSALEVALLSRKPFVMFEPALNIARISSIVAPGFVEIAGSLSALSFLTDSAPLKRARGIAGGVAVQSSLAGSIKVSKKISGVIAATSSLSGSLSLVGEVSRSRGSGFKPIEGAERLRGLRRSAFY